MFWTGERFSEILRCSEEGRMSGANMLIEEENKVPDYTDGRWRWGESLINLKDNSYDEIIIYFKRI